MEPFKTASKVEAAKILKDGTEYALGRDFKNVLHVGELITGPGLVTLPESVTNPNRPTLLDRANLVVGLLKTTDLRQYLPKREKPVLAETAYLEDITPF